MKEKELTKKIKGQKLASLIILNYNGKKDTLEFLESLKKTNYPNYETIVVDNASVDGSVKSIRKNFPNVRIVQNKENLGVAGGKNSGIKVTKGDYIVFLDNDTYANDPNWLSELVKAAESDKKIGIAGIMLMDYKRPDIIQRSYVKEVNGISELMTNICGSPIPFPLHLMYKRNEKDVEQYTKIEDIKDTGYSIVKREVIKNIGEFDEKLFCYFEDTDFCYRAKKAGYRVVLAPAARLLHKGSSTAKHGYFAIYQSYKNKLRFILKNYEPINKIVAVTFNLCYYPFLMAFYAFKGRIDLSRAIRDGIVWNIKNWRDYI